MISSAPLSTVTSWVPFFSFQTTTAWLVIFHVSRLSCCHTHLFELFKPFTPNHHTSCCTHQSGIFHFHPHQIHVNTSHLCIHIFHYNNFFSSFEGSNIHSNLSRNVLSPLFPKPVVHLMLTITNFINFHFHVQHCSLISWWSSTHSFRFSLSSNTIPAFALFSELYRFLSSITYSPLHLMVSLDASTSNVLLLIIFAISACTTVTFMQPILLCLFIATAVIRWGGQHHAPYPSKNRVFPGWLHRDPYSIAGPWWVTGLSTRYYIRWSN